MITNYKKYLHLIKEGLIRTFNIEKYINSLEEKLYSLKLNHKVDIENKFKFFITIYDANIVNNLVFNEILSITNNLGYFPSTILLTNKFGMKNQFKFDIKYLSNEYKMIKITFEAKYEDGAYTNDLEIPPTAYHLTKQKFKEKILKNGLYPKSLNRKSKHIERIYMFYDIDNYLKLLKSLKVNDILNNKNDKYILLQIKLTDKNIIHSDPNYINGFYTTDNISVKNIKLLKKNL